MMSINKDLVLFLNTREQLAVLEQGTTEDIVTVVSSLNPEDDDDVRQPIRRGDDDQSSSSSILSSMMNYLRGNVSKKQCAEKCSRDSPLKTKGGVQVRFNSLPSSSPSFALPDNPPASREATTLDLILSIRDRPKKEIRFESAFADFISEGEGMINSSSAASFWFIVCLFAAKDWYLFEGASFPRKIQELRLYHGLTRDAMLEIREAFSFIERDQVHGTGAPTTTQDLGAVMRSLGQNPSEEELEKLLADCTDEDYCYVEFAKFAQVMARKMKEEATQEFLVQMLANQDKKGSGLVQADVLRNIFSDAYGSISEYTPGEDEPRREDLDIYLSELEDDRGMVNYRVLIDRFWTLY